MKGRNFNLPFEENTFCTYPYLVMQLEFPYHTALLLCPAVHVAAAPEAEQLALIADSFAPIHVV